MRLALRFALSVSIFQIILLLIIKIEVEDIWDQYGISTYIVYTWYLLIRQSFSYIYEFAGPNTWTYRWTRHSHI